MIGRKILTCRYFVKFFLILTLGILACGSASPASTSPMPVPVQETVPAPTGSAPGLTVEQLKNVQYQLAARDDRTVVQLTDGKYEAGADPAALDYASIRLLDQMAFGDLNADGADDAAVLIAENYGGSGIFVSLVVFLNADGQPVQAAAASIDDRPIIESLTIGAGAIGLIAAMHSFDDPMCCPTLHTRQIYNFLDGRLRLTHMTSTSAGNREREISIASPFDGTVVDGTIHLTGGISIVPFEKNLVYRVSDLDGNELIVNSITVTAVDLDGPAAFDSTISLDGIPAGTTVYLEIQDISAANGFLLAMDVVKLIVK